MIVPACTRRHRRSSSGPLALGLLLVSSPSLVEAQPVTALSEPRPGILRLDAETAARRAVELSHAAAAAAERVAAARSEVAAADAERLPELSTSASAEERSSVPELSLPFGPAGEPTTIFPDIRSAYGLHLDLTQPIYTGGRVSGARRSSRHELEATHAEERSIEGGVALRARVAYWGAASGLAAVGAAESQVGRAERLLADARSLRGAGMAVDADVLAAEARVAAARLAVVRARAGAEEQLAELRSLLRLGAGTVVELADGMPESLPPAPDPLPALQAEARRERPEILALAARVDASAAREKQARAARRPRVGATAVWTLARPNPRFLPLADEWNDSWSVGLSARWSLWDGGRTAAAVAAAGARRDALDEELGEIERQVDLEVELARLALRSALAAVPAADASREASAARLVAEEERLAAGLATVSDVLGAQAELAVAETGQVEARAGAWIARARLDWAVGR